MKKSKPKPMFWISGNYYDCQRSWNEIISQVDNPRIDVLVCSYPNEYLATPVGAVVNKLKERQIFDSSPHIIKLKGIPPPDETASAKQNGYFTTGYKLLSSYLGLVNDNKILVIDGPIGYYSKPPGHRFNSVKTSKFFKEFKSKGKVIEHPTDVKDARVAAKWLMGVCESFGKKISEADAKQVVLRKGLNLDALYSAVVLLKDYSASLKITSEDIEKACPAEFLQVVWDLTSSIADQDCDKAMGYLQDFYQSQTVPSAFPGHVYHLLGALHYKFQTLLILKDSCGEYLSYNAAQIAFEGFKKKTGEAAYSTFVVGQTIKDVDTSKMLRLPTKRIREGFVSINDTRAVIRSGMSSTVEIQSCLDSCVMLLCGKLTPHAVGVMHGRILPEDGIVG